MDLNGFTHAEIQQKYNTKLRVGAVVMTTDGDFRKQRGERGVNGDDLRGWRSSRQFPKEIIQVGVNTDSGDCTTPCGS